METQKQLKQKRLPTVGIYDAHNFGQDTIRSLADIYIAPGEDMTNCLN